MPTNIRPDMVRECLLGAEPFELKGTQLLRQGRVPGALFAQGVPREALLDAVNEVVAYSERCAAATRRLSALPSVPLQSGEVIYGL